MKLNIPQLTLAKLAQLGRHQSKIQELPGSIPTGGNFFSEFILQYPMKAFTANFVELRKKLY